MTEARCRDCKRRLKNPTESGYGPSCARKRGLTQPRRRTAALPRPRPATVPPAADALPGQTEIPLVFHQPTLESL